MLANEAEQKYDAQGVLSCIDTDDLVAPLHYFKNTSVYKYSKIESNLSSPHPFNPMSRIPINQSCLYSMTRPATAPTATTAISLLQAMTLAAPVKADGVGATGAMVVPFGDGAGAPDEIPVGA